MLLIEIEAMHPPALVSPNKGHGPPCYTTAHDGCMRPTTIRRTPCKPPRSSDPAKSTSGTRRSTRSWPRRSAAAGPCAPSSATRGCSSTSSAWPTRRPTTSPAPRSSAWAHGIGLSGQAPSAITIGARLACLSSFYRFLIRMGLMAANPCEAIERPKTVPSQPRGLTRRRHQEAARRHPRHADRAARPRHHPDARPSRAGARRGHEPHGGRASSATARRSSTSTAARAERPGSASCRAPPMKPSCRRSLRGAKTSRRWRRRVAVAVGGLGARAHQRHVLRQPAALPRAKAVGDHE